MSKVKLSQISKNERKKMKKILGAKIAQLKTQKEVINFLNDVLTESEFIMIFRRLQIAKMLLDGFLYWEIRKELNIGYDTIRTMAIKIGKSRGDLINFIKNLKI